MLFVAGESEFLDFGVAQRDNGPADEERNKAPGKEISCDEEGAGCKEENEEDGGG